MTFICCYFQQRGQRRKIRQPGRKTPRHGQINSLQSHQQQQHGAKVRGKFRLRVILRTNLPMGLRHWAAADDSQMPGSGRCQMIHGPVAVWCRSFDSILCSKGDEPWAQEEQTNSARMRCELR